MKSRNAIAALWALALAACGQPDAEEAIAGVAGREGAGAVGTTTQRLTASGWDPYFNTPTALPVDGLRKFCVGTACNSPYYYVIGNSSACPVRGPGYDTYYSGTSQLCPNWFNWEWDSSANRWKAHIISVPPAWDGYQYIGVQQDLARFTWDVNNLANWPRVSRVSSVHIQVRARFCASSANARLPYYFQWRSGLQPGIDGQVSIDLLRYLGSPPAPYMPDPGPSWTEWDLARRSNAPTNETMKRTFEVEGTSWGVRPLNFNSSQLWCYSSINNAPWLDFSINIPAIISRLQQEGRLPWTLPSDLQYSGGILGGIEMWGGGGGWAEVEIRDHEIWVN